MPKRQRIINNETIKRNKKNNDEFPKSQICLTLEEKKSFLKACSEHGFNIIYDIKKLKSYLPERSDTEIKYFIDNYNRKAKIKCSDDKNRKDTPLEIWYSLCGNEIRSSIKKEDSSMILVDLMKKLSSGSKFETIYNYLKELMEGKYPSQLNSNDSIIFLSLIHQLSNSIQNEDINNERNLILNLHKKLIEEKNKKINEDDLIYLNYFQQTNSTKIKENIKLAVNELNLEESQNNKDNVFEKMSKKLNNKDTNDESTSFSNEQFLNKTDNPLFYYSLLPKIKKIKECLNPFGIPVDILKEQHSKITLGNLEFNSDDED